MISAKYRRILSSAVSTVSSVNAVNNVSVVLKKVKLDKKKSEKKLCRGHCKAIRSKNCRF